MYQTDQISSELHGNGSPHFTYYKIQSRNQNKNKPDHLYQLSVETDLEITLVFHYFA